MNNLLKRLLPMSLKATIKRAFGVKTMGDRLANLAAAGFRCTAAVDVGAYHGEWARELRRVWPVPVLLVEPQSDAQEPLRKFLAQEGLAQDLLVPCALGSKAGTADFQLQETNSRLLVGDEQSPLPQMRVAVRTLASVLNDKEQQFNLLKVDVQGGELEVLLGAGDRLSQFEVIILEVSVIRIGPAPTILEVMRFMDDRGYRLYDFLPMYYRPRDNALWQGDAFFVRNDSVLVASLEWS